MKYDFPEEEWTDRGYALGYYSYYLEEKNGKELSQAQYKRFGRSLKMELKKYLDKNKDKTELDFLEELKYLLWGMFNYKPQMRSLNYAFYFWGKVEEFKKIKEQLNEKKEEEIYIEDEPEVDKEQKRTNEIFGEFLD